ncbi:MAG TPA: hypothetical protein VMX58_05740 [Patescibacteria group bacterium]|nr:hypothetical protein [Patescibacteria group bacterium]
MSGEHTAQQFDGISHLFLSSRESRDVLSGASAEVTLWLAVHGRACNRALVAAGVAGALSRLGVRCTLVEIGGGLPNVGYYFALEPRDYLAPTLDESRVVTGSVDSRSRFVYTIDPDRVEPHHAGETAADMPHVIVTAFHHPLDERASISLSGVAAVAGRISRPEAGSGKRRPDEERQPDGIVVFTDSYTGACAREIDDFFRVPYPEAVLFVAERRPSGGTGGSEMETIAYPCELLRAWGRRSPPAHPFFADIAMRYLQVISQRRKKGAKRAAV